MKKVVKFALAVLAVLSLGVACSKEAVAPESISGQENVTPAEGQPITICASLADLATKVSFTPDVNSSNQPILKLAWEAGDKLRVANHADHSSYSDFELDAACVGQKKGVFSGTPVSAQSYDVWVISDAVNAMQMQASDGDTGHIQYIAVKNDISSLADIEFSEVSSVLGIQAKLPAGAAATITSVVLTASEDIFFSGKTLTIGLATPGDAATDNILNLYASLPSGSTPVPAGTTLFVKFNSSSATHSVYTAYRGFGSGVTFAAASLNNLKLNCEHTDQYAGKDDDGTEAHPYLIADPYQLASVHALASSEATTYFKMIADVDMTGVTHAPINNNENADNASFSKVVSFDGNGKVISKLDKHLFYVLKGSVKDLTLNSCSVSSRGILAEYCLGNGNIIDNITITDGEVNSSSANVGALVGDIKNDSHGHVVTITNCAVSGTDVEGSSVVGGLIGFAEDQFTMSGCSYTDGTITSGRYAGGAIGSTGNYDSVISDCHVEKASFNYKVTNNDYRAGGFIGLQQTKVQIKGCSVGKSGENVTIALDAPASSKVYNVGGFVGVTYGTITKNGDVRSTAYVTITSKNTGTGVQLNLGGFAGYNTGKIEFSDANVSMTSLKGTYIGGFCGILLSSGKIENCTSTGDVTGNNYTGGFVGVIDNSNASVSHCSSAGTVNAASSIGGFIGGTSKAAVAPTVSFCSSSVTVTSSGSNFGSFIGSATGSFTSSYATGSAASSGGGNGGGFAGQIWETGTASFSKIYATGSVSGSANLGGLIGYVGGNLTMTDCYATGNVGNNTKYNQKYGALVGYTTDNAERSTGVSITNCYGAGEVEASFASSGLIGRAGLASCTVSHCAAWSSRVYPHSSGSGNWSSGAVVGVAFPTCTLTDNYRNPGMNLTAFWVPDDMTSFQHANVSATHPLTDSTGTEMADASNASGQAHYPQYPYHGKVETGKTLSQLASTTLGWSSEIWDFSDDLPVLK